MQKSLKEWILSRRPGQGTQEAHKGQGAGKLAPPSSSPALPDSTF